jgi:hypothetical protein
MCHSVLSKYIIAVHMFLHTTVFQPILKKPFHDVMTLSTLESSVECGNVSLPSKFV